MDEQTLHITLNLTDAGPTVTVHNGTTQLDQKRPTRQDINQLRQWLGNLGFTASQTELETLVTGLLDQLRAREQEQRTRAAADQDRAAEQLAKADDTAAAITGLKAP